MKSFYNDYNAYGDEGLAALDEFNAAIKPVWDRLVADGWNPREISHLWQMSIGGIEAETVLRAAMKKRKAERAKAVSASEPEPRFSQNADGIITDKKTGLEWLVGPDEDTDYPKAVSWVKSLTSAGGGWCMPTRMQLRKLHMEGTAWNIDPLFGIQGRSVWAEPDGADKAWVYDFYRDKEYDLYHDNGLNDRVFAVRRKGRFQEQGCGVILDTQTGLEWLVGPDEETDYATAESWVKNLTVAGGGWQMPTREQLKELYQKGKGDRNTDTVFKTTGWLVWTEPKDASSAWLFHFLFGSENYSSRTISDCLRVFAVRRKGGDGV